MNSNSSIIFDDNCAAPYNCTQEYCTLPTRNLTEWSITCNVSIPKVYLNCKPQEYYKTEFATVGTLFLSIVLLVGVLGNILVCTVVVKVSLILYRIEGFCFSFCEIKNAF